MVDGVRKADIQATQGWDLGMSMVWGLQAQDKGPGESHPEEPKAERGEQLGRRKEGGEQLRGLVPVPSMHLWPCLKRAAPQAWGMGPALKARVPPLGLLWVGRPLEEQSVLPPPLSVPTSPLPVTVTEALAARDCTC